MKSSIQQTRYCRSTGRKVVLALAFASLMGALSISPALAERDDGRGPGARQHVDQGRHLGQRARRGDREGNYYQPQYRRPYTYAQPVYVPPPVYYEPRQSPGITLFFPLDLRR
jgi:hypothetical protein